MLLFKEGVRLKGLAPQMVLAILVAQEEFKKYGLDLIITSANDSEHRRNSYHYSGRAVDLRTKHSGGLGAGIAGEIKKRLWPLGFDVIYEFPGLPNEHIHLEFDRRGDA